MMNPQHARHADGLESVAEALVAELGLLGVEVIFLNPGTDTAPIQEAIVKLRATGLPVPRIVLCPHEAVALAAAHAYFAVTGRPQVVMVHVDVGTQNLGAMMHNAFRGEAGVVVIAGRTPVTAYGELPGGRDHVVHWQQDVPDQAGVVRPYTKWTGDIERPETLLRQLSRAFQIASTVPSGPVYLTVGRETLMEPMPAETGRPLKARHRPPARMAPDPVAAAEVIAVLAGSMYPVITTTRLGRDPDAVAALVELSEILGAPVIDRRERVNFPSVHPAYLATDEDARTALEAADVLVVVDSVVPWVPLLASPDPGATIVLIDADPVKASIPGWSFASDISLQTDPGLCLRHLCDGLREQERRRPSTLWQDRRQHLIERQASRSASAEWLHAEQMPMSPAEAIRTIDSLLAQDDIVIEEATTNAGAVRAGLRRTVPGTLFHPGGSGLGWGLGGALGARLAAPDQRIVAIVGDGSFLFSNPAPALWAARSARAPFLVVVLQNGGYAASRRPVFDLFPDGFSADLGDVVGTRFDGPPDFAAIAEACGAFGGYVETPGDLLPTMKNALAAVDSGSCAVVVVPVTSAWFAAAEDSPV